MPWQPVTNLRGSNGATGPTGPPGPIAPHIPLIYFVTVPPPLTREARDAKLKTLYSLVRVAEDNMRTRQGRDLERWQSRHRQLITQIVEWEQK